MSIAVGFSPVAQTNAVISTGTPAAAATEAESPLGFLGALIETLVQNVGTAAEGEAQALPAEVSLGGLADIGLAASSEFTVATPEPVQAEPVVPATDDDLLSQLVNALAALDQAVADGKPVDPALKKKLTEALDTLAGMLGIQLPAPPAVDPTITAAGNIAGDAATELDPLLEITKAGTPPANAAPAQPAASADAAKPAPGGIDFNALLAAAASTTDTDAATDATLPAATPAASAAPAPVDPNSPLGKIVQKLADLAAALEQQSPELAKKLEVIAQKITAGEINAEALAKLGAATRLDAETVEALLAPKPETKPAPAPQMFTAPSLVVPQAVAVAPKPATETAKVAETPAPTKPEDADKPGAPKVSLDAKPTDKKEAGEPQAPVRHGSFAAAMNDAKADQPAQTQPAGPAQPVQVKTDLGIVAPKAVHAAYQAPMQQVNLPQVAFEVVRQFQQGHSRFQIRLDPPELGRIDVQMKVDRDGNVNARMTVERSETLDLMQRDQRSLEKALAQAGLDSSKTNLEFSLRQNPFAREEAGNGRNGSPFSGGRDDSPAGDEAPEIIPATQYRGSASASGVNLFV